MDAPWEITRCKLGYWVSEYGGYVDAAGRPVKLPDPNSGRAVTPVEWEGARIGILIHDPAAASGAALGESVSTAAALAAANARLQAEVRDQVAQVLASRRRLVEAGADERRRLERRMHAGAGRELEELADLLSAADDFAGSLNETELVATIERARRQLDRTRAEMGELARGLYPRALTERGLAAALSELAEHAAVPVKLTVSAARVPANVAAVAYFVVAEALSNAAKYAKASTVTVTIWVRGREISDSGHGRRRGRCGSRGGVRLTGACRPSGSARRLSGNRQPDRLWDAAGRRDPSRRPATRADQPTLTHL